MPNEVRPLRWPDDRAALVDHFCRAHGPSDGELIGAWYGTFPGFDPDSSFVIDGDDGEIAAHATIIPRQLRIGAGLLPAGEITLSADPDLPAQHGLLHALCEAAHARLTEQGAALGLLIGFPDLGEKWQYEYAVGLYLTSFESEIATEAMLKAGHWDPAHSYERRTAERLGARGQPVTVRRYQAGDLAGVAALYEAASARGHYLIARDEALWEWQLDYLARIGRNEPDDFLVAEVDGTVVAYVRLITQGPVNWFREGDAASFCVIEAAGDHADGVEALMAAIAHTALTFGEERIGLYIHPQSALMQHALARGGTLRAFTGAGLVRLHDLDQALAHLYPTLEQRRLGSAYATRAFRLQISTESEQAEVTLGEGDAELVELEVPATVLVRLITGWYGADHLDTGYHERHLPLLRVLFPAGDPKIALADLL